MSMVDLDQRGSNIVWRCTVSVGILISGVWLGFWGWFALLPYCFTGCTNGFIPTIFAFGTITLVVCIPTMIGATIRGMAPLKKSRVAGLLVALYGLAVTTEWAYAIFLKPGHVDGFVLMSLTSSIPAMVCVWFYLLRADQS
jgi:hypothetical protein